MDIVQFVVPGDSPTAPPKSVFATINGTADELTALLNAIECALHDGPQVVEGRSATGAALRIVIDRFGQALPKV